MIINAWQTGNKPNDRTALQKYHEEIKLNLTWLSSLGYGTPIYYYGMAAKALLRLPCALRKELYKYKKDSSLIDGSLNLITFEKWLKND